MTPPAKRERGSEGRGGEGKTKHMPRFSAECPAIPLLPKYTYMYAAPGFYSFYSIVHSSGL